MERSNCRDTQRREGQPQLCRGAWTVENLASVVILSSQDYQGNKTVDGIVTRTLEKSLWKNVTKR